MAARPRALLPVTALALTLCLTLTLTPSRTRGQATPVRELRVDHVTFSYWPGSERLARRLAEHTRAAPPLPALPGMPFDTPVARVYLAPDAARFDSLTAGRAPEWGAGVAFPEHALIVLPGYNSERLATGELPRVLRHELAHLALHRFLGEARVPRWFDEGYARWAAGEWDLEAAWQLRLAFALRRAPPLDSLSLDWPARSRDARVAYLLSASAVAFLVERGGERGLRLFLERWREAGSFEGALRRTYGVTLAQFEHDWTREVRSRYGWASFLTHSLVFWLFAGLLVVALFAIRRRRDRARLARLRAEEGPDEPAYWLEAAAEEEPEGTKGSHAEPRSTTESAEG